MGASLAELFGLEGRVAVVTGATKGLGRAMAEGYAMAGASGGDLEPQPGRL